MLTYDHCQISLNVEHFFVSDDFHSHEEFFGDFSIHHLVYLTAVIQYDDYYYHLNVVFEIDLLYIEKSILTKTRYLFPIMKKDISSHELELIITSR